MDLYENMINAEYEYLMSVKEKYIKKFTEDTRGKKMNESHWIYTSFFKPKVCDKSMDEFISKLDNINIGEKDDPLKKTYHGLAVKFHPDKTGNVNDGEIFVRVKNLYEQKDEVSLDVIDEMCDNNVDHEKIFTLLKKKEEIATIKNSISYIWCTGHFISKSLMKELFVDQ